MRDMNNTDLLTRCLPRVRRLPHATPSPGFCGETETNNAGDCRTGDLGSWSFDRRMIVGGQIIFSQHTSIYTLDDCIAACRCCRRCAYVSFSAAHQDCSWFANGHCKQPLHSPPATGPDYVTVAVRSVDSTAISTSEAQLAQAARLSTSCDRRHTRRVGPPLLTWLGPPPRCEGQEAHGYYCAFTLALNATSGVLAHDAHTAPRAGAERLVLLGWACTAKTDGRCVDL